MQKNLTAAEIHWQYCGVYEPGVMSEGKVQQRVKQFIDGQTNMHNEDCSGCPSFVNDGHVDKGNSKICENCRFIISELMMCFPQILCTQLCETVAERLHYHEVFTHWVLKMQMYEQKSSTGHQLNVPSAVYSTMKGRNFWLAL
jgi:hypothetical protein